MQHQGEWPVKRQSQVPVPNGNLSKEAAPVYYFEPVRAADTEPSGSLSAIYQLLLSRKWLVIFAALLGALLGWTSAAIQTPMYKAATEIEIRNLGEADSLYRIIDGNWQGGGGGAALTPESYLETILHVLQSRSFRMRVADKLKGAPRAAAPLQASTLRQLLAKVGIQTKISYANGLPPVNPQVRILENTRIVEISCDSPVPDFAADYVDATAEEFIAYNTQLQTDTAESTMRWLMSQLGEMRKKVEDSRAKLEQYSRNSGLLFEAEQPEGEKNKLKELEKELASASVERIARQTTYEVAVSQDESLDARAVESQEKIIKLKDELKDLAKKFTDEHVKVQAVQAQIETEQKLMATRSSAAITKLRDDYITAMKHEEKLRDAMTQQATLVSEVAKKSSEYDGLNREMERNRKLYEELLQKATELSLSTAMRGSSRINILDKATVPSAPYRPVLVTNVGLGLTTGLFLGFGLILISERASHRIRLPGETPRCLGVQELSVVPRWDGVTALLGEPKKQVAVSLTRRLTGALMLHSSRSHAISGQSRLVAEAFRNAAASILAGRGNESQPLRIMVASPSRGEGKSTIIANLGNAIAELGHSVLLVDGDLRVPTLHTTFSLPNSWGLSTLITESSDLDSLPLEALAQRTSIDRLFLLSAGPGPDSVSRILHSRRTEKLFERLTREFEFILIDSPPALQFSDARHLGRLADGIVLVVKAGYTSREALASAKEHFDRDNVPVVGTILNWWNLPLADAYKYYYSYS